MLKSRLYSKDFEMPEVLQYGDPYLKSNRLTNTEFWTKAKKPTLRGTLHLNFIILTIKPFVLCTCLMRWFWKYVHLIEIKLKVCIPDNKVSTWKTEFVLWDTF